MSPNCNVSKVLTRANEWHITVRICDAIERYNDSDHVMLAMTNAQSDSVSEISVSAYL